MFNYNHTVICVLGHERIEGNEIADIGTYIIRPVHPVTYRLNKQFHIKRNPKK